MGPETILKQFSEHLHNEGKVKTTIQSCTTDIRGFLAWLKEKQVLFQGQLTRFCTRYREHLLEQQYIVNTINGGERKENRFSSSD